MDRQTFFGGNPLGVLVRLVLISIVVGIVLSTLDITPRNLLYHLNVLARRIYDLGFRSFDSLLQYFLLGALIVFPIWLIARLMGAFGGKSGDQRPKS